MKNLLLALLAVAFILIGVLFFLVIKKPADAGLSEVEQTELSDLENPNSEEPVAIAVVNLDSLSTYYSYFTETKAKLESRTRQLENDFKAREGRLQKEGEALQQKLLEYQQKAQEGKMDQFQYIKAQDELEKGQAALMKKEQSYLNYKENMASQLLEDEQNMSLELNRRITAFMARYSEANGHDMVLSYTFGANVLYSHQRHDITREVIEGLNAEYAEAQNNVENAQ